MALKLGLVFPRLFLISAFFLLEFPLSFCVLLIGQSARPLNVKYLARIRVSILRNCRKVERIKETDLRTGNIHLFSNKFSHS